MIRKVSDEKTFLPGLMGPNTPNKEKGKNRYRNGAAERKAL